jgi:hypothetical protein
LTDLVRGIQFDARRWSNTAKRKEIRANPEQTGKMSVWGFDKPLRVPKTSSVFMG